MVRAVSHILLELKKKSQVFQKYFVEFSLVRDTTLVLNSKYYITDQQCRYSYMNIESCTINELCESITHYTFGVFIVLPAQLFCSFSLCKKYIEKQNMEKGGKRTAQ